MNKFLSVLMPVYNSEIYIEDAIKSILSQSHREFEFLIIDSSSTDKTAQIIKSFSDERIKYHLIKRCPINESSNYGLQIAKYDLIVRMDSDDISYPNKFEVQLKYFENDPSIDILSTQYLLFENNFKFKINLPTQHVDIYKSLSLHSTINHPGVMYKKSIIIDSGAYNNTTPEDYDLWLRIKDKTKFACTSEILMDVRYYKNSLQRSNKLLYKTDVYKLQEKYYLIGIEKEFGLTKKEGEIISGWRELFYGDKNKSRIFWKNPFKYFFDDKRIPIAFLLSYFPIPLVNCVLELRIKHRIKSFLKF